MMSTSKRRFRARRHAATGRTAALLMIPALAATDVRSQQHTPGEMDGHARYHSEFYSQWLTAEGASCCSDHDCAPIADDRIRTRGEALEVRIGDLWVHVPKQNIRPYQPPDMSSHLCHVGTKVLCFVFGAGL